MRRRKPTRRGRRALKKGLRCCDHCLYRGHSARPEGCQGVFWPGQCLRDKGRIRQGHCRLHGGHSAQPEVCRSVLRSGMPSVTRANADKAIADYTEAIRLNPEVGRVILQPGHAFIERGASTRPLPTTPRPSGSTRSMPWRTMAGAVPTGTRRARRGHRRLHGGHSPGP